MYYYPKKPKIDKNYFPKKPVLSELFCFVFYFLLLNKNTVS